MPVEAIWRSTGLGTAGIMRRQPDGRGAYAMFKLDLREHGIGMIWGNYDRPLEAIESTLTDLRDITPPFEEGPADLAATYIWGAWALGEAEGQPFPPGTAEPFLGLVPKPPGSPESWLRELVGPGGLTPPRLVEIAASVAMRDDPNSKREIAVGTEMCFHVDDPASAIARLQASHPGGDGYHFLPSEHLHGEDSNACFDFVRPLPEGPRSMMPVRDGLQIQGWVELRGNELHAVTLSLSMAAKLGAKLRDVVGTRLDLVETGWKTQDELFTPPQDRRHWTPTGGNRSRWLFG
jgi:hypothetical protein